MTGKGFVTGKFDPDYRTRPWRDGEYKWNDTERVQTESQPSSTKPVKSTKWIGWEEISR